MRFKNEINCVVLFSVTKNTVSETKRVSSCFEVRSIFLYCKNKKNAPTTLNTTAHIVAIPKRKNKNARCKKQKRIIKFPEAIKIRFLVKVR